MKQWIPALMMMVQQLAFMRYAFTTKTIRSDKTQTKTRLKKLDGKSIETAELESFIVQVMEKADVAGLSCAILNDSQIVYQKAFGSKNKSEGTRNNEQTLFSAASFSKTVFAYLVMLLAEEKDIDLDRPLYQYLNKPLHEYPAYADLKAA